jgi:2'-hydroxyisoflavone reductase
MKILVLGGTIFVGRHIVQAAIERGHDVTLFNRGWNNPGLFSNIQQIHGDRAKDLDALRGEKWDAVIDTSGYVPRMVRASAEALRTACEQYIFISTGAVYKDKSKFGIKEDAELEVPRNPEAEEWTDETYGELKSGCEEVVASVYGDSRSLIIRPGIVVGPHDPTDRFTYWPVRIAGGGKVLAPGNPERQTQFIDARDLAEWTLLMVEQKATGIFNAIGPDYSLTWRQFLNECKTVTSSNAELVWIEEALLLKQLSNRWNEIPIWIPEDSSENGFQYRSNERAVAGGLKFRPLRETIKDTLEWWNAERSGSELKSGLSRARESELLALQSPIRES